MFFLSLTHLRLLPGALHDALLDGALADEAVHGDLLGLAQAVRAVHGLLVYCGVPVRVVEDHRVGGREVDAQTASSSREKKDEDVCASLWGWNK